MVRLGLRQSLSFRYQGRSSIGKEDTNGAFWEARQICTSLSRLVTDVFELLHNVWVHGAYCHGTDDKSDAVHPVWISGMHVVASLARDQATMRKLQRLSYMYFSPPQILPPHGRPRSFQNQPQTALSLFQDPWCHSTWSWLACSCHLWLLSCTDGTENKWIMI